MRRTASALLTALLLAAVALPPFAGAQQPAPAAAQAPAPAPAATSAHDDGGRLFTRNDLIAAGAVTAATLVISLFDDDINRAVQDSAVQANSFLRARARNANYLQETYLTAGGLLAYGVGRLTRSRTTADIGLHVAEAVFVASLASQVIRGPLGRARPSARGDHDQYVFHFGRGFTDFESRAFPSIHSASGFAAASVLSREVAQRWPGASWYATPIAYGLAATPGLARVYLGRHWASDVVMGALIGTLAGQKVVSYNHRHPNNRVNRFFLGQSPENAQQVHIGVQRRF